MERNNTLQRITIFMVSLMSIGLFALIGYEFINPRCDITLEMKDGEMIVCSQVSYGDTTVHFKACEGPRMVVPVNDVKEITYQKIK